MAFLVAQILTNDWPYSEYQRDEFEGSLKIYAYLLIQIRTTHHNCRYINSNTIGLYMFSMHWVQLYFAIENAICVAHLQSLELQNFFYVATNWLPRHNPLRLNHKILPFQWLLALIRDSKCSQSLRFIHVTDNNNCSKFHSICLLLSINIYLTLLRYINIYVKKVDFSFNKDLLVNNNILNYKWWRYLILHW